MIESGFGAYYMKTRKPRRITAKRILNRKEPWNLGGWISHLEAKGELIGDLLDATMQRTPDVVCALESVRNPAKLIQAISFISPWENDENVKQVIKSRIEDIAENISRGFNDDGIIIKPPIF